MRELWAAPKATAASVAGELGVAPGRVEKTAWLARCYPQEVRRVVGADVLGGLGPAHLEAVARVPPGPRAELLRRAYTEGMSVRQLRRLAQQGASCPSRTPSPTGPDPGSGAGATEVRASGGAADLASARRAFEVYSAMPDETLVTLLQGPNGEVISGLAEAGRALAERMEVVRLA